MTKGYENGNKILFSIILAFRNEEKHLADCLLSLERQSLEPDRWELILVDGKSEDNSPGIAREFMTRNRNCLLLENPDRLAAAGWNIGIANSRGTYYFPASGHSIIDSEYLKEAALFFEANPVAAAVGGIVRNIGDSLNSRGIAAACNTPLALGGVDYRTTKVPVETEVVGLGIYSRALYDDIGPYNNEIVRSSDWEFNYRSRRNGYRLYITPRMKAYLHTRSIYNGLFLQQFKTGFWKAKVWELQPGSLLPRHAIPSIFVGWCLLSLTFYFLNRQLFLVFVIPVFIYISIVIYSSFVARKAEAAGFFLIAATYPVIHFGYGLGFLFGFFRWGGNIIVSVARSAFRSFAAKSIIK